MKVEVLDDRNVYFTMNHVEMISLSYVLARCSDKELDKIKEMVDLTYEERNKGKTIW